MPLFRVIGFGLFLCIIAIAMPTVFAALAKTILAFLQSAEQAFLAAGILASYAGQIPPPVP